MSLTTYKQRIAVFIGSPYNILAKKGNLYKLIEEKTKSKFKKINRYVYKIESENSILYFYACYKPKKDKSYTSSKKYFNSKGEDTPPPVEDTIKKVKNPDLILIFGTCGSLDGKKNQVYLPTEFYKVYFKETFIKHKEIDEIKLDKKINCDNFLTEKIKGIKAKTITSNVTFIPDRIQDGSKEHTLKLANILSKNINCVDMESYPIVRKFKNKIPMGIFLFSSDVVGKHTKMRFKLREFQKRVSNMIKLVDKKCP